MTDYHSIEFDWDDSAIDTAEQEPLLGEIGKVSGSHIYSAPGIYRPTITITDDDNLATSKSLTVAVAQKVAIDWNPKSNNSEIDLTGEGNIKVAVLGTADFNPATIDRTSIRADDQKEPLLDGKVSAVGNDFQLRDTNGDGIQDLEITFAKSSLRSAVDLDSEPFTSQQQIYLFGSSSSLDGGFFLGMEE